MTDDSFVVPASFSVLSLRHLLRHAGELPARPRILDLGRGPDRSTPPLAAETGGAVMPADPALATGTGELPYPDGSFDLIWAEDAASGRGCG
ncbi:transferase, partial [Streptomyces sp. SID14478]|nr:transferase [Streptomyces sp. SID14478]